MSQALWVLLAAFGVLATVVGVSLQLRQAARQIESPLARAGAVVGIFVTLAWFALRLFPSQVTVVIVGVLGVAVALSVLTAVGEWRVDHQRARLAAGQCVRCGYDLRGTPTATRCPDCGAPCVARRPRPLG